jgi:hypothetical protein
LIPLMTHLVNGWTIPLKLLKSVTLNGLDNALKNASEYKFMKQAGFASKFFKYTSLSKNGNKWVQIIRLYSVKKSR